MTNFNRRHRRGFTLIELLVVIGIIVLLMSILIPVLGKVRDKATATTVKAQLNSIESAIRAYEMAFEGLPGPLTRFQIGLGITTTINVTGGGGALRDITGSENLTLGLLGGLKPVATGFEFDPAAVGRGPRGLNPRNPRSPAKAFLEGMPLTPSWNPQTATTGEFVDAAGDATDTVIPEMVDRFSDPLPILFFRAHKGARGVVSIKGADDGTPVFPPLPNPPGGNEPTQFDLNDNLGYTQSFIGVGKKIAVKDYKNAPNAPTQSQRPHGLQTANSGRTLDKSNAAGFQYPYDAFPYFVNRSIPPTDPSDPNGTGTPQMKDAFILISAGLDRVYGTSDDLTNLVEINP